MKSFNKKEADKFFEQEPTDMFMKPKKFKWKTLIKIAIILSILFIVLGLIGTIFSLKKDVAWYGENQICMVFNYISRVY